MINITIIGAIGAFLLLLAFVLNQLKKWKNDDLIYDLVNLIGGLFLVLYAYLLASWPFLVLNAVWTFVSLRDVFIDAKRIKKFS